MEVLLYRKVGGVINFKAKFYLDFLYLIQVIFGLSL